MFLAQLRPSMKNKRHYMKKKASYIFDNIMSRGPIAAIGLLIVVSLLIIFLFASFVSILNIFPAEMQSMGFLEAFWISLMRTLDPGTMGDDTGWPFRITMLLVTTYGIVMLSTFIGLISNAILKKIQDLRKGRSTVLEDGHVLILGWSPKIHTIISELVIANENQKHAVIVVLADKDKVEMEDEIREKVGSTKNTKVVCRTGLPIDVIDLEIASPRKAKSIIILDNDSVNSDAQVIKVILAITSNREGKKDPFHIIAEMVDQKNLEVARMVGKSEVELILSDDFISRIMVQTSRQSGLSVVYTDLLDFDGDEIYFYEEEKLFGKTFGEALFHYDDSALIGIEKPDGTVLINPDFDMVLEKGSKVIAISEDDDTVILSPNGPGKFDESLTIDSEPTKLKQDNILILGWNRRTNIVVRELANYTIPGATIHVVANNPSAEESIRRINELNPDINITFQNSDTTNKEVLQELDIAKYNHLLLLSYQDQFGHQEADAKTLITLLHLRQIAEKSGSNLNIVSEMLDVKNRELAKVTTADDFIVSDNIISLLMSQIAENKSNMRVFERLFDADGNQIFLKPATEYVKTGVPMNFYTVLEAARKKGEIALGYRIMSQQRDEDMMYGVRLNPVKSETITLSSEDRIIVLV